MQRGLPGQSGRVQCSPGHREKLPACGQRAGIVGQRFFTWCFAEQPWATDSGHEVVAQKTVEIMTSVEVEWDLHCFADDTNMVDRESVVGGESWCTTSRGNGRHNYTPIMWQHRARRRPTQKELSCRATLSELKLEKVEVAAIGPRNPNGIHSPSCLV